MLRKTMLVLGCLACAQLYSADVEYYEYKEPSIKPDIPVDCPDKDAILAEVDRNTKIYADDGLILPKYYPVQKLNAPALNALLGPCRVYTLEWDLCKTELGKQMNVIGIPMGLVTQLIVFQGKPPSEKPPTLAFSRSDHEAIAKLLIHRRVQLRDANDAQRIADALAELDSLSWMEKVADDRHPENSVRKNVGVIQHKISNSRWRLYVRPQDAYLLFYEATANDFGVLETLQLRREQIVPGPPARW